jgi:hypothetical protein
MLLPVPFLVMAEPVKGQARAPVPPPAARRQAIVTILEEAQLTRDMNGALKKNGKSLTADDRRILLSLSSGELAALRSARSKLGLRASP